jgi:hypothetical protein
MDNTKQVLTDAEKLLVAMGAAIGGGCGKCAENLVKIAHEQGVSLADMATACKEGFAAKGDAVKTMKAKVATILKAATQESDESRKGVDMKKMASLIRTAAFAAANSAPDTVKEMKKACLQGAAKGDFRMCLSIAKSIRKKAEQFSDEDVAESTDNGDSAKSKTKKEASDTNTVNGATCSCGCN